MFERVFEKASDDDDDVFDDSVARKRNPSGEKV